MESLISLIEESKDKFVSIAPPTMKYESEVGFAGQILKNNAFLKNVAMNQPQSFKDAIINVASIGLSLNPAKKQAYLIPRKSKDKDGKSVFKIFLEPSYIGMCDLATMTGVVKWVRTELVYEGEDFCLIGLDKEPIHKFNPFSRPTDTNKIIGGYCTIKTKDGDYLTSHMSIHDILAVRDRSESWKAHIDAKKKGQYRPPGPWGTDFKEMAKKTLSRNSYKMWPKEAEESRLAMAVDISNKNEGFTPLDETEPNIGTFSDEKKVYFDRLIENNKSLDLYALKQSLCRNDENINLWINLCGSFPRGKKGHYGKVVEEMISSGENEFLDIQACVNDGIQQCDDNLVVEIIEELSDDVLNCLKESMGFHEKQTFDELISKSSRGG